MVRKMLYALTFVWAKIWMTNTEIKIDNDITYVLDDNEECVEEKDEVKNSSYNLLQFKTEKK
ncbi:MAG: hypothetical protein ACOCSL_00340 [Thermoplasmatota archaeon]